MLLVLKSNCAQRKGPGAIFWQFSVKLLLVLESFQALPIIHCCNSTSPQCKSVKMLSWAIPIRRKMHDPSVENEFSMCVILTYVPLDGGAIHRQENTLTNRSFYYTHGKLLFN